MEERRNKISEIKKDNDHTLNDSKMLGEALKNNKDNLAKHQVAPLLLDEWEYHNDAFSQAVYRYGLAIVSITIAPYLVPGLIKELGNLVFLFPIIGFVLAFYATYHLASISMYVWQSDINYRKVMGKYAPTMLFVLKNYPYQKNLFKRILLRFMKFLEEALLLHNVNQQLTMTFFFLCVIIESANIWGLKILLNKP
jgi:hypothetical protein